MRYTSNYKFPVPEENDFFNVQHFADMMDAVDARLKKTEGAGGIYVGGAELSTDATVNDESAEYDVIQKEANSLNDVPLFSTIIDAKIGIYALMLRAKVSDIAKTASLISVKIRENNAAGQLIKEFRVSPDMFDANNKYKVLGTIIDFNTVSKGTRMYIEGAILKTSAAETVAVDYILINPAYTSVSAV